MGRLTRVAFVIDDITTGGGIERVFSILSNLFIKQGYDVSIISLYKNCEKEKFYFESKVEIFYINHFSENLAVRGFWRRLVYDFRFLFTPLKKFLKQNKFDILIGSNYRLNIALSLLVLNNNVKVIGTEHIEYYSTSKINRFLRLLFYNLLDALVVLTYRDASLYKKHLNKVYVIENPLSFIPSSVSNLDNNVILSIGRFTNQKGFDLLLKSFQDINFNHPDWTLIIVGSGEKGEALKEYAEKLGVIRNVQFLPPTDKILDIYLSASVFALSSRYEGFPMVLVEAMVSGLAVVSFKCPTGPEEIINDGIDGMLVDCFDTKEFAKKVNLLIANLELRKQIALNARTNIIRYSDEKISEKWVQLFRSLTNQPLK